MSEKLIRSTEISDLEIAYTLGVIYKIVKDNNTRKRRLEDELFLLGIKTFEDICFLDSLIHDQRNITDEAERYRRKLANSRLLFKITEWHKCHHDENYHRIAICKLLLRKKTSNFLFDFDNWAPNKEYINTQNGTVQKLIDMFKLTDCPDPKTEIFLKLFSAWTSGEDLLIARLTIE